ncbi:MAG: response regulator [Elusimicrobium sp.]|jgi:DNA-binding response OmpR family regulator|nr:response regulator [Elusimicrobium sp.]
MKRIVIVEDDPSIAEMTHIMLQRAGFEVLVCDNGREAVDFIKRAKPDLVLLDVMLPGMDGSAIAKELGKIPETSFIPIVVTSALEESRQLFTGISQVRGFCSKPFTLKKLLEAINSALA